MLASTLVLFNISYKRLIMLNILQILVANQQLVLARAKHSCQRNGVAIVPKHEAKHLTHTELTAGLVTSTEQAEAEGKNRFSTGTLNAKNLDNHANYKGSSVGVSTSVAANFQTSLGDRG